MSYCIVYDCTVGDRETELIEEQEEAVSSIRISCIPTSIRYPAPERGGILVLLRFLVRLYGSRGSTIATIIAL